MRHRKITNFNITSIASEEVCHAELAGLNCFGPLVFHLVLVEFIRLVWICPRWFEKSAGLSFVIFELLICILEKIF